MVVARLQKVVAHLQMVVARPADPLLCAPAVVARPRGMVDSWPEFDAGKA